MITAKEKRGGAPVGFLAELDGVGAASIIYLRMWHNGPESQADVWTDLSSSLGADHGRKALKAFETLCSLCSQHGRRQLMLHAITCKCIGSDESCFANFIATAATGEREDAMLIATLLVRADIGPIITSLAADFGLALVRMNLSSPKDLGDDKNRDRSHLTTFH
jgi:hypothetical protein